MTSARDLVYFVGSIPLKSADAVFSTLSKELGPYLRRIPDGETGERQYWIKFQQKMLNEHPAMEIDPTQAPLPVKQADGTVHREIKLLRLKLDADPDKVEFDTGYDRAALADYAAFRKLRDAGVVPSGVRFQFALPTPMAAGIMYVSPAGRERYLRAYERSLLAALGRILGQVPHADIAVQFDVCQEVLMFENYFPVRPSDYKEIIFRQFGRLGNAVPAGAELGFHLCYGSPGDQPLVRLDDASVLVEMMDGIAREVQRRVDFIHIPVPREARDSFFAPLKGWNKPEGMQLYLGLLQHNDTGGDAARIAAAQRVLPEFGVAAECGFGRTDPARVPSLLASHRAAAELVAKRA